MIQFNECPECGTYDTERVHMEQFTKTIECTRICNVCPTQFTNKYDLFTQAVDDVPTMDAGDNGGDRTM